MVEISPRIWVCEWVTFDHVRGYLRHFLGSIKPRGHQGDFGSRFSIFAAKLWRTGATPITTRRILRSRISGCMPIPHRKSPAQQSAEILNEQGLKNAQEVTSTTRSAGASFSRRFVNCLALGGREKSMRIIWAFRRGNRALRAVPRLTKCLGLSIVGGAGRMRQNAGRPGRDQIRFALKESWAALEWLRGASEPL